MLRLDEREPPWSACWPRWQHCKQRESQWQCAECPWLPGSSPFVANHKSIQMSEMDNVIVARSPYKCWISKTIWSICNHSSFTVRHPKTKHPPVTNMASSHPRHRRKPTPLTRCGSCKHLWESGQKQANVAPYLNDKRNLLLLVPSQEFQSCMNILITKTWSQNNQHSQIHKQKNINLRMNQGKAHTKLCPNGRCAKSCITCQLDCPKPRFQSQSVSVCKCVLFHHKGNRKQQKQRFLWLVWLFFTHFVEAERPGRNP